MAPRSTWSGALTIGVITVPIKLYSRTRERDAHFNQIDSANGARIKQRKVNAKTGEDVPNERIVKGYELGPDTYVTVTDDELTALAPVKSKVVEITSFVPVGSIDPDLYEKSYYIVPDTVAAKSYRLFVEGMQRTGQVGIASIVMRSREHLVAIRPVGGALVLSTLCWADEVVPVETIPGIDTSGVTISDREAELANMLVGTLSGPFDHASFRDEHRERVLALVEAKGKGELLPPEEAPRTNDTALELLEALEQTIVSLKEQRAASAA